MNVYFLNDAAFIGKRLSILYDILKIKKIIFFNYKIPNEQMEIPQIDSSMLLYKAVLNESILHGTHNDIYEDDIKKMVMQAVYKFNMPICRPNMKGGFIINDKYRNSNAHNPIYNLEFCDDDNVLVLCDAFEDYIYPFFINYSINILKKYASELHYEDKICFIKFKGDDKNSDYPDCDFKKHSYMFYHGEFKSLSRFLLQKKDPRFDLEVGRSYSVFKLPAQYELRTQLKEFGIYYDPLISYINMKLKELYPTEIGNKDILTFLYGEDVLNTEFENTIRDMEYYEYQNDYYYERETDAWGADSEIEYIMQNGGDWIND